MPKVIEDFRFRMFKDQLNLPEKKIICVDFDGVLHSYKSGWKGIAVIPDEPIEGALPWLLELIKRPEFEPVIYSSRSCSWSGRSAMKRWLRQNYAVLFLRYRWGKDFKLYSTIMDVPGYTGMWGDPDQIEALRWGKSVVKNLKFPTHKPPAHMTVDDRAFCFNGTYPGPDYLLEFKPYRV